MYEYQEFGTYTSEGDSDSDETRFTFTGAPYFTGPGLYQMGARYYNPEIGRFITNDTYRGNIYEPWTQNLYTYCNNNPVNYVDPTGHFVKDDFDGNGKFRYSTSVRTALERCGMMWTEANISGDEKSKKYWHQLADCYRGKGPHPDEINPVPLQDDPIFIGLSMLNGTGEIRLGLQGGKTGTQAAYRYVSEGELNVIKATGKIPNVDRAGNLKDIFVSPNKYDTILEAEKGLQIGKQNPFGPTGSPVYRVEFNMNSVNYRYGGNVEGGTGIEMITEQSIPVDLMKIYKLR
ncbi:Rhs family protein [Desulfocucumis palustris]|uniref:Rhs family protein n=2 Tax=Desulfocucumis palustris TaxID=1898651 RepID=A0A2L2X965_9FIRM|nr:Rhs family protein [Desulfocucumis palustris]